MMRRTPPTAEDREWAVAEAVEVLDDGAEVLDAVELVDDGLAEASARGAARWEAVQAAELAERLARIDACLDAKIAAGWRSTCRPA
jgi:hypothetical protein